MPELPPTTPGRRPGSPVPLSVWPVAQTSHRAQRIGRYLPVSNAHPARMLPALARHAIERYSRLGELVVDPMCGIGTTLVEAAYLGRDAVGVELEPRWAELAERNLWNATYTTRTSRANLATAGEAALLAGMVEILAASAKALRPGGLVVLTARPWRRGGILFDFPGALEDAAEQAGLVLVERAVALLAGLRDQRLVPRASFFALDNTRKARAAGLPVHVIAYEDVLVFSTREGAWRP
jgi:modification methylase